MNNKQLEESAVKIAEFTEYNNHTAAIIEVAGYIARRDGTSNLRTKKALHAIDDLHNYFGHCPPHLQELRQKIQVDLFEQLNPLELLTLKAGM